MRNTIIISSIASVITRFSVKATAMLRGNDGTPQDWQLERCGRPLQAGNFRANLLLGNLMGLPGSHGYQPVMSSPSTAPSLQRTAIFAQIPRLFQRLS